MLMWQILGIVINFIFQILPDWSALIMLGNALGNGRFPFVSATFAIYLLLICFFGISLYHRLKARQFA